MATPIINQASATAIRWTNPPYQQEPGGLNLSVRIAIFKDGVLFRTDDTFTDISEADGEIIEELPGGTYKIKYKQGWSGTPDSDFSNEVVLDSQVSATPTIVSHDTTIPSGESADVVISGVGGAAVYSVRGTEAPQYIGTIDGASATGNISYSYTTGGTYKFYQIEPNKSQSAYTASITITSASMASCNDGTTVFRIDSASYNKSTSILTFQFYGSGLTTANYTIKAGETTVASGNISPTSNTVNITLPALADGTFTLTVVGVSCTGTATKGFTVTTPVTPSSCNNGSTVFNIASASYDASAGSVTYQFNASSLSSATWRILQGTTVKQSGSVSHTSNTKTIAGINTLTAGNYTFELTGVSCTGVATLAFTVGSQVASCNDGTTAFSISAATYNASAGNIAYSFIGSGLSSATWRILSGTTQVQAGSTTNTSNNGTITSVSSLSAGNYTLEITGVSCTGTASRAFTVASAGTTKTVFASAKVPSASPCTNVVLQFGYSNASSVVPTIWADSTSTKRLLNTNGVITEVTSGGDIYQTKNYDLAAGTYHFFSRQKDLTSNAQYLGQIVVTI